MMTNSKATFEAINNLAVFYDARHNALGYAERKKPYHRDSDDRGGV